MPAERNAVPLHFVRFGIGTPGDTTRVAGHAHGAPWRASARRVAFEPEAGTAGRARRDGPPVHAGHEFSLRSSFPRMASSMTRWASRVIGLK